MVEKKVFEKGKEHVFREHLRKENTERTADFLSLAALLGIDVSEDWAKGKDNSDVYIVPGKPNGYIEADIGTYRVACKWCEEKFNFKDALNKSFEAQEAKDTGESKLPDTLCINGIEYERRDK